MKIITILFLTMISLSFFGQTDKEEAYEIGMKAIKEMEAGNIDEAIEMLEESAKLDPQNINYPYEIAYAHYLDKNYSKSIKVLKKLTKKDNVNARVWQMLGNCYDMEGDPDEAIKTYETGLEHFPNSGILYLERGNMELQKEAYNEALGYYEKGIKVDPEFPSNYYWASKLYLSSTEEVWGLLYGEIFMNIERNSQRTVEISGLLYKTYESEIEYTSDSSLTVSFCQQMSINASEFSDTADLKLPFCMVYEPTLMIALIFTKEININSLSSARTNFIENYYKSGHHNDYPNVLFDYQKRMEENGHLEAYSHWVLMKGDEELFSEWYENNTEQWDSFVAWFSENPIKIDKENYFHTSQY
jgi:tetratricopeptide (TPR) repeat protein